MTGIAHPSTLSAASRVSTASATMLLSHLINLPIISSVVSFALQGDEQSILASENDQRDTQSATFRTDSIGPVSLVHPAQ